MSDGEAGMSAAMAAFDAEFDTENATVEEKISTPDQGLAAASRPTGQTTYTGYVKTFGRHAMSTLDNSRVIRDLALRAKYAL